MAVIRCAMCGEPNPDDLEFCQWCEARLKPLSAASPDDLPILGAGEGVTPLQGGDSEQNVPDWLQSLRESAEPELGGSVEENFSKPDQPEGPVASLPGDDSAPAIAVDARRAPVPDGDEEIPDWLMDLRDSAATPVTQPDESTPTASLPPLAGSDWLARLDGETSQPDIAPETVPGDDSSERIMQSEPLPEILKTDESLPGPAGSETPHEQPPTEELPDWLESLKDKASDSGGLLTGEEELPDWLAAMPVIPADGSLPEPNPEPEWMKEFKGVTGDTSSFTSSSLPPSESVDSPDSEEEESGTAWEQKVNTVFTDKPSTEEGTAEEIPDWLSALKPDREAKGEEELPLPKVAPLADIPEAGESEEQKLDWLSELVKKDDTSPSDSTQTGQGEDSVFSDEEIPNAAILETPEWISKLAKESSEEIEASVTEDEADDLKAADLPSWVQAMRPMEAVVSIASSAVAPAAGDAESSGPLAGLRGVLPAGTGIEIDRKPPLYSNKLQVTDGQLKYAAQLERMVLEEGQAKKPRHVRLSSNRLLRWVISIILIFAIIIPLVDGRQITPDMKLFPSEWTATTALLDNLPASAPVLLVSDFEPAFLGELQASASPVIERMLDQGARFSLVSTSPTGTALASQIIEFITIDQTQPEAHVTNLGYLPGGPAGIYNFASNPQEAVSYTTNGAQAWDTPALQGVGRFDGFALLLLLTDNADTGRAWIEQTRSFIGDTPILMVISAQAEPMLRPYFSSGQIHGLVTGLAGGKIYEQSYGQMGLARDYWDSFGTGTWTAVIMMVIGSVIYAGLALSSRKKGDKV